MKFNNESQIVQAVNKLRKEKTGKNMHYPVQFKKAVCDYLSETKTSVHHVSIIAGIKNCNLYTWVAQYNDGLYSLEGAYSVSKKSQKLNHSLLEMLNQKKEKLVKQIELVQAATELGLKVQES